MRAIAFSAAEPGWESMVAIRPNEVVLIAVLVTATATDVTKGKIYNFLTLPAIAAGILLALVAPAGYASAGQGAWAAFLSSIAGIGVMLAAGMVLWSMRILGGGDVKLLMAVGSLKGLPFLGNALLYSALAGGVLAVLVLVRQRKLKSTAQRMASDAAAKAFTTSPVLIGPDRSNRMPYGLAIAAGCIAALIQTWAHPGA